MAITNIELTSDAALSLVQPFFTLEWSKCKPEDITVDILSGGYTNSFWIVKRKNYSQGDLEPQTVILKKKGGKPCLQQDWVQFFDDRYLSIMTYETSKRGLGPKLYGIFPDGSVEEYVQSHTLTYEESADPVISADIAKQLARIHAITNIPFPKSCFEATLKNCIANYHKFRARKDLDILIETDNLGKAMQIDVDKDVEWLKNISVTNKLRKNLILSDMNFGNCLVLENQHISGNRTMLIDYDAVQMNFRGIDLGSHFFFRTIATGLDRSREQLSDSKKRYFLTCYQDEIRKLNLWPDFDDRGTDSLDNLLNEAYFGQTYFLLNMIMATLGHYDRYGGILGHMIDYLIECYLEAKEKVAF